MASFFIPPKASPTSAGDNYSAGNLYIYLSGTSTPAETYQDADLSTPHEHPIVADANGVFPVIWLDPESEYRVQLKTSADALVYDVDPYIVDAVTEDEIVELLTAEVVGAVLYPLSGAEEDAGITPTLFRYPPLDPRRYGATGDGVADDTVPVQSCLDVAAQSVNAVIDLKDLNYLVDSLSLDCSNVTLRNGVLTASSDIPASGAIIFSLAGGSDTTVNQALLDGIYGSGVKSVRTNVANSLINVRIENVTFVGNANAIRGFWATGFTRGCKISGCYFDGIDGIGICLNGSWSFSLIGNHIQGDGTNGVGIALGQTSSFGERSGSSSVNAATVVGNEITGHATGMIFNFGFGGHISGNIFESNVGDGFASQSVEGLSYVGNYHESNGGDNLQLGGTNGTDFAEGWLVSGNHFTNTSGGGNNIKIQGAQNCRIEKNNFAGTRTQWYNIPTSSGVLITGCDIEVPDLTSTYVTNASAEIDGTYNTFRQPSGKKWINAQTGDYSFTKLDPARITYKASGAAATWTVPANASVPMAVGTELEGFNNDSADAVTLAVTSDTLVGSATVAIQTGFLLKKVDSTTWLRVR